MGTRTPFFRLRSGAAWLVECFGRFVHASARISWFSPHQIPPSKSEKKGNCHVLEKKKHRTFSPAQCPEHNDTEMPPTLCLQHWRGGVSHRAPVAYPALRQWSTPPCICICRCDAPCLCPTVPRAKLLTCAMIRQGFAPLPLSLNPSAPAPLPPDTLSHAPLLRCHMHMCPVLDGPAYNTRQRGDPKPLDTLAPRSDTAATLRPLPSHNNRIRGSRGIQRIEPRSRQKKEGTDNHKQQTD